MRGGSHERGVGFFAKVRIRFSFGIEVGRLALDTLYINAVALLVLTSISYGKQLFYEAAILIALLGFVGTVSLAKFLLRGDIIE